MNFIYFLFFYMRRSFEFYIYKYLGGKAGDMKTKLGLAILYD